MPDNLNFAPKGKLKELTLLFFPILAITFSNCLFLLVEKLLLARLSSQAMEAAVNVAYACQIFQGPCVALTMMAQVYVGRWLGAQKLKEIGPGIWQFIWFSFLSMFVIIPLSIAYGNFYFKETIIEEIALPYYYFLITINFLYPLGATLTCFYLGQGKTLLVLFATIASQVVKLLLAYLLIFGWGWIPSFGIMGGAVSTLIAQGGFCLLLLVIFLNRKHAKLYNSREFRFQPKLFWECINPGFLRALNRILNFTSWASIAHLMVAKGDSYLQVLSVGGTLFLFLPFLGDAICQAQTTTVSNLLGAKKYGLMNQAFMSGSILVLIITVLMSIPLVLFPMPTFTYLFSSMAIDESVVRNVFLGVWVSFAFFTFGFIPISYILAFKDTKFSLFMGGVGWINGFLMMYVAIEKFNIEADQFWLVLSLMHGSSAFFYFWRMRWLQSSVVSSKPKAQAFI